MIRDPELINQLVDTIARFVRERLIPNEARRPGPDHGGGGAGGDGNW